MTIEDSVAAARLKGGWVRLDRLGLIKVTGPQRVKFLHNLLSNDVNGLVEGQSRLAALMNLKGQQVAWMRVLATKDALICELPKDVRQAVVDTFVHYKVGAPVRFEQPDSVIFGVLGAGAGAALLTLGFASVPSDKETFTTAASSNGMLRAVRASDMPAQGFTLHADPANAAEVVKQLSATFGDPLSTHTLDTLRVEEGLPWHGIDVKEENLLHETGQLETYHSASKGCYLGQEVVARLEGRGGNVNKKFRGFKSSTPMNAGDEIRVEDKVIGRVTSAGLSPEFGPIAMGYVHRSNSDPGAVVQIGGADAEVVSLPFKP